MVDFKLRFIPYLKNWLMLESLELQTIDFDCMYLEHKAILIEPGLMSEVPTCGTASKDCGQ